MRRGKFLTSFVLLILCIGTVPADTRHALGGNWNNDSAWDMGGPVPTTNDDVYTSSQDIANRGDQFIAEGASGVCNSLYLSMYNNMSPGSIRVDGTLNCSNIWYGNWWEPSTPNGDSLIRVTDSGVVNVSATVKTVSNYTPQVNNRQVIDIAGGTLDIGSAITGTGTTFEIFLSGDGYMNVAGGVSDFTGTIDLQSAGAQLKLPQTSFNSLVSAGCILANGVTVTSGNMSTLLIIDLTTSPGNVIVTVNSHVVCPEYAWNPSPADNIGGVAVNSNLSWLPGNFAISHDVYFGTSESAVTNARRLAGDINGDGPVGILDLSILAAQWLTNPGAVNASADVEFSGKVDLGDFAALAATWNQTPNSAFRGNQPGTTYNPALTEGTTYYWRIDEVNASQADSPWIGTVWSFTAMPTKQFGYLYTYFDWYGGGQLNDIPSVAGYTNMNHFLVYPGDTLTGIQTAISTGTKVLLDVKFLCFEEPSYHDWQLRSDWQYQLNIFKAQYAQYSNHIAALTPMDEPYWHGVTESEVEVVAAKLRADWPGIPIYLNLYKDGWGGMDLYHRTSSSYPGIDWVAFDTFDGHTFDYNEFENLLDHLKSIKTSSQKIILNIPNMSECGTDAQIASWNWAIYNNLMKNDDEIIGALIWLGDSYRMATYGGETALPQNKAALEDIGHLITGK